MQKFITAFINIGGIGFLTGWIGMFTGMLLSLITTKRGNRFKGTILGFIGGLMLAVICFDILPESFEIGNLYIGILGVTAGLIIAVLIDGNINHINYSFGNNKKKRLIKAAMVMAIGVGLHNIPAGIALGSLINSSFTQGLNLIIVLVLHGIPEGLAIGLFLKESGANIIILAIFSFIISIPLGIGTLTGALVGKISPSIISISLAFAGGLILYIICRETLPEAKEVWRGRLSAIGNVLGIIVGIIIISFIH